MIIIGISMYTHLVLFVFFCNITWYLVNDLVQNLVCRNAVSHRSQNEINAEIYGELSTNLFKLEKVCPVSMHCTCGHWNTSHFKISILLPALCSSVLCHISKYYGMICIQEKHCLAKHGVISECKTTERLNSIKQVISFCYSEGVFWHFWEIHFVAERYIIRLIRLIPLSFLYDEERARRTVSLA